MPDEVSEALEEMRRQREALKSERDILFWRIAGPLDRLSEIAGKPKQDARELVEEKRRETPPRVAVDGEASTGEEGANDVPSEPPAAPSK